MTLDHMKEVLQDAFDKVARHRSEHEMQATEHDEAARNNREIAATYALKMHEIHESARKLGIELDVPMPEGAEYVTVAE